MRAWVFVLLIALAGCTADEPAAEPKDESSSTLGRIAGATVTPDIRPISGVSVVMTPGNFEATSNLFGGFTFENVPPGTYEITAAHADYDPATEVVTVTAGQTAKPRLVLEIDAPPQPAHFTETFNGYIPLSAGPAENATGDAQAAGGMGNCTCVFPVQPQEMMRTLVIEGYWDDSLPAAQPTAYRWTVVINENRTYSGTGSAPLLVHLNDADVDGWDNTTKLEVRLVPDDVWPAYEQSYQLTVTVFQVAPAPDGWTSA